MKIIIETIPHDKQLYPTCGDWRIDPDGTRRVYVSDTGNDDYAFLVALHEMIEQRLCEKRGITVSQVDEFDKSFESKREAGNEDEPGDDPAAPYRKEHFFATNIEALMSAELGVNWQEYEAALGKLG